LDNGEKGITVKPRLFFQTWWLGVPGFLDLVSNKISECIREKGPHRSSIDLWKCISRVLRQLVRGWEANLRKRKREAREALLHQVKQLDALADSPGLGTMIPPGRPDR
jgi:hypothetical protein